METTMVLLKPDAVANGYIGALLNEFEVDGLRMVLGELMVASENKVRRHYKEHAALDHFEEMVRYYVGKRVFVALLSGDNAVEKARRRLGHCNPDVAGPGTLRSKYGTDIRDNGIHASDSQMAAVRETGIWFVRT